jgi:hypothetical protein
MIYGFFNFFCVSEGGPPESWMLFRHKAYKILLINQRGQ